MKIVLSRIDRLMSPINITAPRYRDALSVLQVDRPFECVPEISESFGSLSPRVFKPAFSDAISKLFTVDSHRIRDGTPEDAEAHRGQRSF